MSSAQGRGRGRADKPPGPLRKPGNFREPEDVSQNDEKPPVQKLEQTVSEACESGTIQLAQDAGTESKVEYSKQTESENKENILLKAVNNPEFIPRSFQEPAHNSAPTSSSSLASAVNAPEFVPGKTFFRHEESPEERLLIIQFVNNKIQQLTKDPGLLDELSVSMANYLSACITVENDMITVSDILFEKCVSEPNFQYTGSKLANYLDKYLVPKSIEQLAFRKVFLKRCSSENVRFMEVIHNNPERACNVAIFLGELLMNYKTADGQTITKFLSVVSSIIKQLLQCHDKKLLICAGKLLKLTGSSFDQSDEMFVTVEQLANNPQIDKTAQILFTRVSELRRSSWGQHETPQSTAYTQPNAYGAQGYSMYIPNMDGMLEEQAPDLPVCVEEEWNEYATDGNGQDETELNEDFYRRMCLEQYGHYVPYATEDNWPNTTNDDYDADFEDFLKGQQQ